MKEIVTINFNSDDVVNWNHSEMILDSIRYYLFWDRNIEYIFSQIKNWDDKLKDQVENWLRQMDIKNNIYVWFVSIKTKEKVFKIIFTDKKWT